MKVMIKRSCRSLTCNPIDVAEISGCHWDNVSGGYMERHAGYALYGYIAYEQAIELVDCSGRHAGFGNEVKIMIPANRNNSEVFRSGFMYLRSIAGKKPLYRQPGQKPCTKRILSLVIKGSMTRKCLRMQLKSEFYTAKQITRALKRLGKLGRVILRGSPYDSLQLIEAVPEACVIGSGRDPP